MNASVFSHTPAVTIRDARGLTVRDIQYHHLPDTPGDPVARINHHQFNSRGFLTRSADPRLHATGRANFTFLTDLSGTPLQTVSADAGTSMTITDAARRPVLARSANGTVRTWQYESASLPGRPLSVTEQAAGQAARIMERFVYAGHQPEEKALNLAGQCVRHYDTAGRVQINGMALTGTAMSTSTQLLSDSAHADWQGAGETQWEAQLTGKIYTSQTTTDVTGNILTLANTSYNVQRMVWDRAGLLKGSWLAVRFAPERVIVKSVTYSAAGQVLQEVHGNGVVTTYEYEPQTQRLTGMKTERPAGHAAGAKVLQDLRYEYDPVGNVVKKRNDAEATRFWRNQKVVPEITYVYDSLYQLARACGREMANAGQSGTEQLPAAIVPVDSSAYTNYTRTYTYDDAGNLTQIRHSSPATNNSYTTNIAVSDRSNRAVMSSLTADPAQVEGLFMAGGQQKQLMPGQILTWNGRGELADVSPVVRPGQTPDRESYQYDSNSQRVCKTTVQTRGDVVLTRKVIYLPGLELRSAMWGSSPTEHLEVSTMGVGGRAQVRVLHWDMGQPWPMSNAQVRYNYADLIESAGLEVDENGNIISQEEFYPYGGTAVLTARSQVEADYKMVKYSGKERDATGLYYYGYRYYQPWSGRWLSADPAGTVDGLNLYRMVRNNPGSYRDNDGLITEEDKKKYLNPTEYEIGLFRQPKLPSSINIDPDAVDMLLQSKRGNAFVGLMHLSSGDIYLNPVLRRQEEGEGIPIWTGSNFEGIAKVKGIPVEAIEHNANGVTAHIHFYNKMNDVILKKQTMRSEWIGFGIRSRETYQRSLHLTSRSYSLNARHFKFWVGGNRELAFQYHQSDEILKIRQEETSRLTEEFVAKGVNRKLAWEKSIDIAEEIKEVYSAPNWKDVIDSLPREVTGIGGELPHSFSNALLTSFRKKLSGKINIHEGM